MMLLPPAQGSCPICAVKHAPQDPHDAQSLYYQYRFYGVRGRWPTWADAVAHCEPSLAEAWKHCLNERGAWTEPEDGQPIADPPEESVHQPIGDVNAPGFGPQYDPAIVGLEDGQ